MLADNEWHLDTQRIGRRVLVFDRLDSTNDRAAELAVDPANDGLVILAQEQTAGRGQQGRRWQCPAGSGVLLSVLLFPPAALRRPSILTAWAAVSVCETILEATRLQAKIKWPNDVLIRGRKVCGILIEARGEFVVAGIGLNVNQSAAAFTQPGLEQGTSLALKTAKDFDCPELARLLIRHLDADYDRLCRGDTATLEACWKWRIGLLGRQVQAECATGMQLGRLRELGWQGVELEQLNGETLRLSPESVRHLGPLKSVGERRV